MARPRIRIGPGAFLYPDGHPELAGSFGIGVREKSDGGRRYLLTAAHVVGALCPAHDPGRPMHVWTAQGRAGGSLDDSVGFVDLSVPSSPVDEVEVDAALVRLHEHVDMNGVIRESRVSARIRDVTIEAPGSEILVYKRGATQPHLTEGLLELRLTDIDVKTKVKTGSTATVQRAFFDGYFIHSTDDHPFGHDGDSGSVVVDEHDRVVGMLVALTGTGKAFMFPIKRILDSLDVELFP